MWLDLFKPGDVVLLIGEGNFSFGVGLRKHNLPIEIVATCFEPEIEFEGQQENIDFLEDNKVPCFLDVDATKLHEHPHITEQKYTKIIFNFPHVGGKMKIQLNRELLQKTFLSARRLLRSTGQMLVSLCRGQGGTPADEPQRRWDDSWQITEMAAYGNFVLVAVDPFVANNFPDYHCVGYRGQDVEFGLEGALVHIFSMRKPPYKTIDEDTAKQRLSLNPMDKTKVTGPVLYSELYEDNPLKNPNSPVSYLKNLFEEELQSLMNGLKSNMRIKTVSDEDISICLDSERGVICKLDGVENGYRLRLSPTQVLNKALLLLEEFDIDTGYLFFPGMYFNPLSGRDFLTDPPISFQFLFLGRSASTYGYRFIHSLAKKFQRSDIACSLQPQNAWGTDMPHPKETIESLNQTGNIFQGTLATEWVYTFTGGEQKVMTHVYSLVYKDQQLDACVVYPDKLAEVFFGVKSWRELWADKNQVVVDASGETVRPILRQAALYPTTYDFDLTFRYGLKRGCDEDHVLQILWLAAGRLIEAVELLSEFHSPQGWSSKCYRITYRSLDKPLHRSRVIDIHSNVVGKMLSAALKVTIS